MNILSNIAKKFIGGNYHYHEIKKIYEEMWRKDYAGWEENEKNLAYVWSLAEKKYKDSLGATEQGFQGLVSSPPSPSVIPVPKGELDSDKKCSDSDKNNWVYVSLALLIIIAVLIIWFFILDKRDTKKLGGKKKRKKN